MDRAGFLPALLFIAATLSTAEAGEQWTYYGEAGPERWPQLGFSECAGERQSPINLVTNRVVKTRLPPIKFQFFDQAPLALTLTNNYHSATAEMKWEKTPVIEGGNLPGRFEVINFHFHWGEDDFKGSEHTIDGESFPLEMHIVCQNTRYANLSSAVAHEDGLAVLGVMFEAGDWAEVGMLPLEPALRSITAGGAALPVDQPPRLQQLLPLNTRRFYRYRGSLTTPGCHQAVTWTVFTQAMNVNRRQMALFRSLRGGPAPIGFNYRPPQRRHGRTVILSTEEPEGQQHQYRQLQRQLERLEAVRSGGGITLPPPPVLLTFLLLVTGVARSGEH